jgi:adenosyl cobinamide kinase/adenosyl cobinamide phosphate guanylyltransferase
VENEVSSPSAESWATKNNNNQHHINTAIEGDEEVEELIGE